MRDLSAVPDVAADDPWSRVEQLETEIQDLSARLRSQVPIATAVGILMERYGPLTSDAAFGLLRAASQRHNVKVRVLADAVVAMPAPKRGAKALSTAPVSHRPPPLGFLPGVQTDRVTRDMVTAAVLETALSTAHAQIGNVQLADPVRGGLRIVNHVGHPDEFLKFFAHVGETGSACAVASEQAGAITISDVAVSPVFTEQSRAAMLAADCRAVHSIPLNADGEVQGVVSTHYNHRATGLSSAQAGALSDLATQAGTWLAWQQHKTVLDALTDLHRRATTKPDR